MTTLTVGKSPCETCGHRRSCNLSLSDCSVWLTWFRRQWRALRKKYLKGRKKQ